MTAEEIRAVLRQLVDEAERRMESENKHENDRQLILEDLLDRLAELATS
jgi:hypothetical protein